MDGRNTRYYLLASPEDAQLCERLRVEAGEPWHALNFPTVLAKRSGKVMGYLSSWEQDDGTVILGPLVLAPVLTQAHKGQWIARKLWLAMEQVLRSAGIERYQMFVARDRQGYLAQIQRLGLFTPIASDTQREWFERDLACSPR